MFARLLSALMTALLITRICSLFVNQLMLFLKLERQYQVQYENDIYTANAICQNEELMRGIGEKNSKFCQELEDRLHINPKVVAFKDVLDQTYLCGTETCASYIKDGVRFMFSDWKAGLVLSLAAIVVINCSGLIPLQFLRFRKRRDELIHTSPSLNSGIRIRDITSELPFHKLPYSEQFSYSTNAGEYNDTYKTTYATK